MQSMKEILARIIDGQSLSREEAAEVMDGLMAGHYSEAITSALLVALRMKGETVEEITGFAETMRRWATPIYTARRPLVDTCGTGGDGAGTFNISTTVSFVVAGAGVAVAKHGNRSASSRCGSADVLEALGVNINATPEQVGQCIDDIGIGFLFARTLHTAMKHVAPVRAALGCRTIFNLLGPLTNPARADGQVIGVYDCQWVEPMARVLAGLGVRHAFVVAGGDGLDELTLHGPSHVAEVLEGRVRQYEINPLDLGFPVCDAGQLQGGDALENAQHLRRILEGAPGPHRDIVLLNAAPALMAGAVAADWREGVARAAEAIDSGAALGKLEQLREALPQAPA